VADQQANDTAQPRIGGRMDGRDARATSFGGWRYEAIIKQGRRKSKHIACKSLLRFSPHMNADEH
jgi:hypothetical protein